MFVLEKNEDNLYPPSQGFQGAELFKNYIQDVLRTREIPKNSKYKIKKNKLTKITEQGGDLWIEIYTNIAK